MRGVDQCCVLDGNQATTIDSGEAESSPSLETAKFLSFELSILSGERFSYVTLRIRI